MFSKCVRYSADVLWFKKGGYGTLPAPLQVYHEHIEFLFRLEGVLDPLESEPMLQVFDNVCLGAAPM